MVILLMTSSISMNKFSRGKLEVKIWTRQLSSISKRISVSYLSILGSTVNFYFSRNKWKAITKSKDKGIKCTFRVDYGQS